MDSEATGLPVGIEEICYEMHSTGVLCDREVFGSQSIREVSEIGDRMQNLIDDVWWNV